MATVFDYVFGNIFNNYVLHLHATHSFQYFSFNQGFYIKFIITNRYYSYSIITWIEVTLKRFLEKYSSIICNIYWKTCIDWIELMFIIKIFIQKRGVRKLGANPMFKFPVVNFEFKLKNIFVTKAWKLRMQLIWTHA